MIVSAILLIISLAGVDSSLDETFTGTSPDGELMECIELKNHPFFVAVQFHPELKSRPFNPSPLFVEFIKSAINNRSPA